MRSELTKDSPVNKFNSKNSSRSSEYQKYVIFAQFAKDWNFTKSITPP